MWFEITQELAKAFLWGCSLTWATSSACGMLGASMADDAIVKAERQHQAMDDLRIAITQAIIIIIYL